jgi:hypothetical protein
VHQPSLNKPSLPLEKVEVRKTNIRSQSHFRMGFDKATTLKSRKTSSKVHPTPPITIQVETNSQLREHFKKLSAFRLIQMRFFEITVLR